MDSADKWISPFAFKLRVAIDNKSNIPHLPFNCSYASSVINKMRNPLTICGIRLLLRIPQINFADSTHICGFHLHFAKSTYSCGIQNNQLFLLLAESATKQMGRQKLRYRYMYAESTEFYLWNSPTFKNIFQDLFLDFRNIQTQNCAPIECTVWPRNVRLKEKKKK